MNRRGFLKLLGMTVGGIALEQAIPLGRVWSFPSEIVIARPLSSASAIAVQLEQIRAQIPIMYATAFEFSKLVEMSTPLKISTRGIRPPVQNSVDTVETCGGQT